MSSKKSHESRVKSQEELQVQVIQLTDALQRERADAMNVRRRSDEERAKMAGFYKSLVVRELLPTIDNFERALKHAPGAQKHESESINHEETKKLLEWVEGVKKIVSSFEGVLAKIGVERIKTVGEPFSPSLHEAVSMEDMSDEAIAKAEGEGEQEIVSEELQSGYTLGDEVIRHAMVKVSMR